MQPVFGMGFAVKVANHDAVWMLLSLEAHSTFMDERNGQLFIEKSLMADHLY